MDVSMKLFAKGLIDPGINGPAVHSDMAVVATERVLGEVAKNLRDTKVWNIKEMAGLLCPNRIDDDANPLPRPREIKGPWQVVAKYDVGIQKQVQLIPLDDG